LIRTVNGACRLHLTASVEDLFAGFDGVEALALRRLDAEQGLELVGGYLLGLLGDSNGPLTLRIGMAPYRADPGTLSADIAAHQGEVDDGLDGFHAFFVLSQSHSIDEHHGLRVGINCCGRLQRAARKAGTPLDLSPVGGLCGRLEFLKAVRVLPNEVMVDNRLSAFVQGFFFQLEQNFRGERLSNYAGTQNVYLAWTADDFDFFRTGALKSGNRVISAALKNL